MKNLNIIIAATLLIAFNACRDEKYVPTPESEQVGSIGEEQGSIIGFYLLNEGNMGSNKATLDYYDYASGTYTRNIYASANPTMVQELGDVGNDLQIYGNRLYAVVNCSNFVEVMDARSAKHIGTINVPNCRYLAFSGRYGYVSSYAGPVNIDPSYSQIGYVAKFDTATLQILDTCLVGYQPDEIEIVGNRLYVANSGGYMVPNYENTVSVIDLDTFKEIKRIEVVNNLHRLVADSHNQLWVSSRGDYLEQPSRLYCIDLASETLTDSVDIAVSDFSLHGDSLFIYGTEFSYETYETKVTYGIVDVNNHKLLTDRFITDETELKINMPYGISVNPQSGEIYVTDAKNYVSPGTLYCFKSDGTLGWSVSTGDIPAHIAYLFDKSLTQKND